VASATVVAKNASDAGALSTAFTALPVRESHALAAKMRGVEYLLARRDGGVVESAGWRGLLLAPPGYTADVFLDRATGTYDSTETRMGFVALMNDLHKGRDSGRVWSWVID